MTTNIATPPRATKRELHRAASLGMRADRIGEFEDVCPDAERHRCTRACADFTVRTLVGPQSIVDAVEEFSHAEERAYRRALAVCSNNRIRANAENKMAVTARRLAVDLRARPRDESLRADARQWIEFRAKGGR